MSCSTATTISWAVAVVLSLGAVPAAAVADLEALTSALTIEVAGAPSTTYDTADETIYGDHDLAAAINSRWRDLRFSSRLSRAARAYARATVEVGETELPPLFLSFLIGWSGCLETDVAVATVSTSEDGVVDVLEQLARVLTTGRRPITHVGLGRVAVDAPPFKWRWAVILSRRRLELEAAFPTSIPIGSTADLRFRPAAGMAKLRLAVIDTTGSISSRDLEPGADGWFGATVSGGSVPGTSWQQIIAASTSGPEILAHFPIAVGVTTGGTDRKEDGDAKTSATAVWCGRSHPDESFVHSVDDAEALMVELLNADRRLVGLASLQADAGLAGIARAHSRDMKDHGFFAHSSPVNGNLQQRLARGSYHSRTARENISRDASVYGAQTALWHSPGHRANILATDVSRLGIGIVVEQRPGREKRFVVTQIFADPANYPTAAEMRAAVSRAVAAGRDLAGLSPMEREAVLDKAARKLTAPASETGKLSPVLLQSVMADLDQGGLETSLFAELLTTSSSDGLVLRRAATLTEVNRYGIGVRRRDDHGAAPMYTIVVLYGITPSAGVVAE